MISDVIRKIRRLLGNGSNDKTYMNGWSLFREGCSAYVPDPLKSFFESTNPEFHIE